MVIGVDVGICVGLPLNFIVIIAGPSFFGDWESEFFFWSVGRTTFGSFASSVWELLTEGGGISLVGRHLEASLPLSAGR